MNFQNISAGDLTNLLKVINGKQSNLLFNLYNAFSGLNNATIALGPGYGTHASPNTITLGQFSLPSSGFSGRYADNRRSARSARCGSGG
jgi:hypothetical protein